MAQVMLVYIMYTGFVYGKVHYIFPSWDDQCPQNSSCFTLSQLAAGLSYNESDISFQFLPGNHTLDQELSLTQINISLTRNVSDNEKVFVECSTESGRFHISDTTSVSIANLHFIGCGNNVVSRVKLLTIIGSTFQNVHGYDTVLELVKVSNAIIVGCSFLTNSLHYPTLPGGLGVSKTVDYIYFKRHTRSGTLYAAFSNIFIITSEFMYNKADIGGALVAHNSSLYLAGSTCSYNSANFGGVMVTSGSTIDANNNTFINNAARWDGGAIVTFNDTFTISSTTFNNNSADRRYGGVMETFGGSSFNISTSDFSNNSAACGGVIESRGNSLFSIINSNFVNNKASDSGGVIWCVSGQLVVDHSTFVNNKVNMSGGAIWCSGGVVNVNNSYFVDNKAIDSGGVIDFSRGQLNVCNSTFADNEATGGGVIRCSRGTLNVANTNFIDNKAFESGGVIRCASGTVNVYNSKFRDNQASDFGGVIQCSRGTLSVDTSTFVGNKVNVSGGVIRCIHGALSVDNSDFKDNKASISGGVILCSGDHGTLKVNNSNFVDNQATVSGGVIRYSGATLNVSNTNFMRNKATMSGGVIHCFGAALNLNNNMVVDNKANDGGVIWCSNGTVNIENSHLEDNKVTDSGGVIRYLGGNLNVSNNFFVANEAFIGGVIRCSHGTLNVNNTSFVDNKANMSGGVIWCAYGTLNIDNSNFEDNQANYFGGVVWYSNGTLNLSKSAFIGNKVAKSGGVIRYLNGTLYVDNSSFKATSGGVIRYFNGRLNIDNSTFIDNEATEGGVIICSRGTLNVKYSSFADSKANKSGAVIQFYNGTLYVENSSFVGNEASESGGVIRCSNANLIVDSSYFRDNKATESGGVIRCSNGALNIDNSNFVNNKATSGGVIRYFNGRFNISNSTFDDNKATEGGVILCSRGIFNVKYSNFADSKANKSGAVIRFYNGTLYVENSSFVSNEAIGTGGVVQSINAILIVDSSYFRDNIATESGGVIRCSSGALNIDNSNFVDNKASTGGVIQCYGGTLNLYKNKFVNNKATDSGGAIWYLNGVLNVISNNFSSNTVSNHEGGVFLVRNCSTHVVNSVFDLNIGSFYTFNSNVTLHGFVNFHRFMEPYIARNGVTSQGGAITSFLSNIIFTEGSAVRFTDSTASHGGAISCTESTIIVYGETTILNNMAKSGGGGIFLKQSRLEIKSMFQIMNNVAETGGGIHTSSSTIAVYTPGTLQINYNSAELGGGIYLEQNPKLYYLKNVRVGYSMNFTGNNASYGGALYVADDTNSGACLRNTECFFQTLALHQLDPLSVNTSFLFSENRATEQGSDLFGGLLDRCISSPFAEVHLKYDPKEPLKQNAHFSGVIYLQSTSNIELGSITSQPVRVCFCNSENEPYCNYQPPPIRVQKGSAFNVSLVAVDHVNHTVDANITTSLSTFDGGLDEDQQIQHVGRECSNLTLNVFSPHNSETLNLYPDGPCGSATLSTSHLTVQFIECTCPLGFQPFSNSQPSSRCECVCDPSLSPEITECSITISSVLRMGTNSWITYINDTDPSGYVVYPNCPFDFCQPQTENVTINFNLPNGADSQCAYGRMGTLCGACKENLSLSLASSHCLPCHPHWLALFFGILVAAAIAGILFVTVLLSLNITVSVGLINGFVFYANIVSAGSAIFFSSSQTSFPSVFVAWLNLDIGIDVCFIDGLDAYTKTWLQLVFPVYIITLVVIVIILSEYSLRFAALIGRKDPISTLATLILLSYAKLLSTTITALSSAVLDYPDGQQETVWLPDVNVPYFKGKHIPLALVALLIIILGIPYTILLFLWQWIVRAPRWKVFNWIFNTKLNAFITSHHVPHNSKYRYWSGLLLLVRIVLYIIASVTTSANPETFPLVTGFLLGVAIIIKCLFGVTVFKNTFVDVVDTVLYFNLLALVLLSLYNFKADVAKQTAVAYISTIITSILFIAAMFYHVKILRRKKEPSDNQNKYVLDNFPDQCTQLSEVLEVTHSVVDPPAAEDQDPPPKHVRYRFSEDLEITDLY